MLRLAIILALSVFGACAPSSLIDAMEVVETSEEACHRSGGRQSLRPIRAAARPSRVRQVQAAAAQASARISGEPARRPPTGAPARRIPSSAPDSASASDDHLA